MKLVRKPLEFCFGGKTCFAQKCEKTEGPGKWGARRLEGGVVAAALGAGLRHRRGGAPAALIDGARVRVREGAAGAMLAAPRHAGETLATRATTTGAYPWWYAISGSEWMSVTCVMLSRSTAWLRSECPSPSLSFSCHSSRTHAQPALLLLTGLVRAVPACAAYTFRTTSTPSKTDPLRDAM